MLSKTLRMKSSTQFDYIFKKGQALKNKFILVFYSKCKANHQKFGVVVSKKIGHSVVRNQVKRKIREVIKTVKQSLCNDYNYIFVARCGIENLSYNELLDIVQKMIKKSEIYV